MKNRKIRELPENELHEVIWYIISDLYTLSKEFEWYIHGDIISTEKEVINISKIPLVRNHFSIDELCMYSNELFESLEKLLQELKNREVDIRKISEYDKEKLVAFMKKEVDLLAMSSSWYRIPDKFLDMLFFHLWLDHIDSIWDTKAYTKFILAKIMEV